jgi:hypothetical protein
VRKAALALFFCFCVFSVPLRAQIIEEGYGGALAGAVLGSLVGGHSGAAWGAAIGGGYGLIQGANERDRRQEAEAAYRRQQEERLAWEREDLRRKKQEMTALAARQECCPPSGGSLANTSANAAPSAHSLMVLEVKKSLVRMGYDPGPIDDQMNPKTVAAIRAYEVKYSLLETGRPSQELLRHMLQHGG